MALQWKDKLNQALTIAGNNPGGIPNAPYDPPREDPNKPWVPAPKRDKLAGGPYRMNKEGNAEVWEFGPKNYNYHPMPKSYYDLIKSVRGMNFKKADAAAGTKIINELPRGGWPARNSHRGLVDKDKLLDTMKRATSAFQA